MALMSVSDKTLFGVAALDPWLMSREGLRAIHEAAMGIPSEKHSCAGRVARILTRITGSIHTVASLHIDKYYVTKIKRIEGQLLSCRYIQKEAAPWMVLEQLSKLVNRPCYAQTSPSPREYAPVSCAAVLASSFTDEMKTLLQ